MIKKSKKNLFRYDIFEIVIIKSASQRIYLQ